MYEKAAGIMSLADAPADLRLTCAPA